MQGKATCISEMWHARAKEMNNLLANEIDFWRNLAEVSGFDTDKNETVRHYWYEGGGRYERYRKETVKLRTTDDRWKTVWNKKAVDIPWKKKGTGTSYEILQEGVQVTVSNREQTAGQWVDEALLDPEDDNTYRPKRHFCVFIDTLF